MKAEDWLPYVCPPHPPVSRAKTRSVRQPGERQEEEGRTEGVFRADHFQADLPSQNGALQMGKEGHCGRSTASRAPLLT